MANRAVGSEGIRIVRRQGKKIIEVDERIATYWGHRINTLGAYGRRKFENMLFLENADRTEEIAFCYSR